MTDRNPDTVTFTTVIEKTYVVERGRFTKTEEGDERLQAVDLWAEGEHVTTYTGDYDSEIPTPDADWIVSAALEAGIFVLALGDRT